MEYEVTFVSDEDIELLSGSICELGQDAGRITWQNCLDLAEKRGDGIELDYKDARSHFAEYGAWEREEIDAWSDRELQALVIQETAADLRELEAGGESSRAYRVNGKVYIYLGN